MTEKTEEISDNIELGNVDIENDYKLNLRKETQHFIIHYTEFDKRCIDKVSDVLENSYNRITNIFNQQLQEKLIIEIHPDHNQLHIALGFPNAPEWVRGGLGIGKIVIASPLNPPPGSEFHNVLNTAVHEFVHIIVNKINENTPRWLNEGIACYEAKDNNGNWIIKTVKNGLANDIVPTFKDLDTGDDFETFFKYDGYQYSYTIVESIIKLFGYDKLCNLIKEPNSFVDVFGITEDELHTEWIDYIKMNYALN
ncbi:peptidase MA family metallohydrolase [Clostridium sp. YIM B02569]|uniref:peptidase MA family metallohydrolase n=1 Tax=Clostridium sp. YIM B02569 TaxID=2911967 RepID=UPI001EEB6A1A|nr:peptidase MA family metallohydrolase [Clostridium sp. YIM B02569]